MTCVPQPGVRLRATASSFSLLLFLLASVARANSVLTMSMSSPDDLANLTVGQTFTVNVSLGALGAGEQLQTLTGGVDFPSALLGSPVSISPGAIVPNPLANPLDFQTVSGVGQADASFVTFSMNAAEHITSNGVFYSFTLTALAVGSGQIEFDTLALIGEQFDPNDPQLPILRPISVGAPLDFTIKSSGGGPGPIGVPLPAAAWGGLALIGVLGIRRWCTGRAR